MKAFIFAAVLVAGALASTQTPRYMVMQDEQGHLRVENLHTAKAAPKVEIEDIAFHLFTPNNLEESEIIPAGDFEALKSSAVYDPLRKNAFVCHGWTGSQTSTYVVGIKDALLTKFEMNVFIVDWSKPAGLSYFNAVKEVVPSGQIIGNFAHQMIEAFGITEDDFLLMGHSLGGQLVGAIGAAMNGGVNTIIALDPAGPIFSLDDTDLSLDVSDAQFVHVIHTNDGHLGFPYPVGHADYFPNGGKKQNGCGTDATGTCAHGRCNAYYIESILSGGFRAVKCDSYEDFTNGLCEGNEESYLGREPVDKSASGSYYLDTAEESPFSLS